MHSVDRNRMDITSLLCSVGDGFRSQYRHLERMTELETEAWTLKTDSSVDNTPRSCLASLGEIYQSTSAR